MSNQIVIFIVDNEFKNLYFTTADNYSLVLDKHNITPDRVQFTTMPWESLLLLKDGQLEVVVR